MQELECSAVFVLRVGDVLMVVRRYIVRVNCWSLLIVMVRHCCKIYLLSILFAIKTNHKI